MTLKFTVFAAAFVAAFAAPGRARADTSTDFDRWADKIAAEAVRSEPVQATLSQYFQGEEQATLDGKLAPINKAWQLQEQARRRELLADLKSFNREQLTAAQRTSAALIGWSLEQDIAGADFIDDRFVFNQMSGLQVSFVGFMSQQQPLRNARDVQSYLERLAAAGAVIDEGVELTKTSQEHGVLMPRFITEKVIAQFDRFLADAPNKNLLVTSFSERLARLNDVSPEQREAARAQAEKIVAESVIPAYRRALALLQSQLPLMNNDAGLWRLPNGDKVYAAALRRATTTDYTPQQIHAIGLAEVARIEGQMDGLLRKLGYKDGSVKERYARLEADIQPKAVDPRPELLARYTDILRDAERRAKLIFDITPKAPIEVRREPALTEATAAAHYTAPAPDGSRPGIFWAPLPGPSFEIAGMRTLVYHEGVPGHHFQIALQQEETQLPRYRRLGVYRNSSAYTEGWALYAEQLAAENHWYDGDDVGLLGQLNDALFRARRLVVDTGLHAMKWTRQQAIDYGMPAQEVDRYVVWPGQACSYMLGRLKIEALRDKARKELGDKFEIRKFHNLVLQTGDVPLMVLETVVDEWIEAQKVGAKLK
ncbi:MAG TPA: DUF885 domain-containing protein [Burkholderiaceae bacterium]|jgi:uncharacterized protein (DUF885 family)